MFSWFCGGRGGLTAPHAAVTDSAEENSVLLRAVLTVLAVSTQTQIQNHLAVSVELKKQIKRRKVGFVW